MEFPFALENKSGLVTPNTSSTHYHNKQVTVLVVYRLTVSTRISRKLSTTYQREMAKSIKLPNGKTVWFKIRHEHIATNDA